MANTSSLQARRREIAEERLSMRSMHPGNINDQYVRGKRRDKPVTRGRYPVLCWRQGKKVLSERLTSETELERARQDVANHRRFKELCKEFEALTQRLGELERPPHVQETFAQAALDFKELAGLELCRKEAQRIAEQEDARMEAGMREEIAKICVSRRRRKTCSRRSRPSISNWMAPLPRAACLGPAFVGPGCTKDRPLEYYTQLRAQ